MSFQSLITSANNNQGVIAIGIFLLGVIGFLIRRIFFSSDKNIFQKQRSGNNSINIQSGQDTKLWK